MTEEQGNLEKTAIFESGYILQGRFEEIELTRYIGKIVIIADTHDYEGKKQKDNISVRDMRKLHLGVLSAGPGEGRYTLIDSVTGEKTQFFYSDLINIFVPHQEDSEQA